VPIEDHVLRDLARIRLVDAPAAATARVGRILGTTPSAPDGDADIVVRWVDRVRTEGTVRWIGRDRSAADDGSFYVVERGPDGARLLARLPLDRAGEPGLEIECDAGLVRPPALIELLNLRLLARGIVPIHGSAFRWRDRGVLAAGWSKGGKTEALLAFVADGADVIADEWTYALPDGRIVGVAEPVRIEQRQAEELGAAVQLPAAAGRRFRLARLAALVAGLLRRAGGPGRKVAEVLASPVERARSVTAPPGTLFGDRYLGWGTLDHAVALFVTDRAAAVARPTTPERIADRMVFAHVHHRRDLVARYHELRFAFPDRRSELLERVEERERELLHAALVGVPCTELQLPSPPTLASVHEALAPQLEVAS
jgi:hypothetical protein